MIVESLIKRKEYSEIKIGSETYKILPIVELKYQLKLGKEISLTTLRDIINENNYYYYDKLALKKLKKMITKSELKKYLLSIDAPINTINTLMTQYEKNKYIDDYAYVKVYIEKYQKQYGPKLIEEKLLKLGIEKNLISKFIPYINESIILDELILKKLKTTKGKTKKDIQNKVMRSFIQKGYNEEIVKAITYKYSNEIKIDMKKEAQKVYQKLERQYQKIEDIKQKKYKIKQKMYINGFDIETINALIDND